ncbi:SDR family NAD(P)-dependent oxidoreductase [Caminibacter mediatlanticus TB-2]|uniref:Alcohol dehydrogenase n=1 Tax=Caminibacter mediatlanticus TB-2 TaxID=391592 RepID=A0AAI9F1U0_9BACT|nr:SDR family NAD(P)-dependent oxidoreductase [Caminibacter mediatlanticus]EDM23103.1 alcohol dehydrogenase [Caminibacter mediatlanticus TB-2]QCT94548.1 SDR family NAD(P)-dependent oxidoreductase [Caminibacter mediatlanticus TB-2]
MKVLITGISRGIGYGLVKHYLEEGYEVYGLGRSNPFGDEIKFYKIDLTAFEKIPHAIESLEIDSLDLAILNAGILGEIKLFKNWSVKELNNIFDVNVWSNKVLIDEICEFTKKIVVMSSGAAVNGNPGWGGYALSKCAVNMMVSIYSKEIDSKIYALAPGVIDTDMVRKVISGDKSSFPSLSRVEETKVDLESGVLRIVKAIERLDEFKSGSFIDVRLI